MKEILLSLIEECIKPQTLCIKPKHSWKSYDCLANEDYEHLKVNYAYHFVNLEAQCHTNAIESMWLHIKTSLPTYNKKCDFKFYFAEFLFRASYEEKKIDAFNTFLELVKELDWTNFKYDD
ncbi:putative transposase-like protein [Nephila pilipes]|uniref:Putative transposase-like protein n=1 Tax=Nephila pilipes TaxID=299642 RepID=A0A8X6N5Y3_NEPPI|nr:putative transposase-like protein [Nephila pilipes]